MGDGYLWVMGGGVALFAVKTFKQGYSWIQTLMYIVVGILLCLVAYRASELFFYKSHWLVGGAALFFVVCFWWGWIREDITDWD